MLRATSRRTFCRCADAPRRHHVLGSHLDVVDATSRLWDRRTVPTQTLDVKLDRFANGLLVSAMMSPVATHPGWSGTYAE
jgi:hypothetical protein